MYLSATTSQTRKSNNSKDKRNQFVSLNEYHNRLYSMQNSMEIPYIGKFLRLIFFAVFMDYLTILLLENSKFVELIGTRESSKIIYSQKSFKCSILENFVPQKFPNIWDIRFYMLSKLTVKSQTTLFLKLFFILTNFDCSRSSHSTVITNVTPLLCRK